MKVIAFLAALVAVGAALSARLHTEPKTMQFSKAALIAAEATEEHHRVMFHEFKQKFNKAYETQEEHEQRFQNFVASIERINQRNQQDKNRPFGITKFSDMTTEEFKNLHLMPKGSLSHLLGQRREASQFASLSALPTDLPNSFDWRDSNGVTPVKDQGQCGSCWAFSTTENVESVHHLQGGKKLIELSVEQIVDCDENDDGCNGGDLPTAFEYVIKAGGLEAESEYPYVAGGGEAGNCQADSKKAKATIDGWEYATKNKNETEMQIYMQAKAPLAICVDAETWQDYTSGIVTSNCKTELDHCVQLVGWNQDSNGTPYWMVRNSWNTDWGEQGYIFIERNKNLCGIAEEAASAYVNK